MNGSSFGTFDQLVRENQRVVYQVVYGVLGNAADAEDITQDAFVQAYAKLSTLRNAEHFRSWVCSIGRRLALNRLRSDGRTRERETSWSAAARDGVDVETVAEEREFESRVSREIDRLPAQLREVLLFSAIEGLDSVTVAGILGIPPGTVRSRLHMARKLLLERLAL